MRLLLFIFALLVAIPVLSKSQDPIPRCFKAYNAAGKEVTTFCVGEVITFRDCSIFEGRPGVEPDKEYYDYDKSDGVDFTGSAATEKRFTYTKPGTYTVTQYARDVKGVDAPFERTFEVKAAPAPLFSAKACANRSVQVNITDTTYDLFDIDFGDGTIKQNTLAGEQPPYTYSNTANSFTITVQGKFSGGSCENSSTRNITLLPAPTVPIISRLEVIREEPTGEISLSLVNLNPGYQYVIERFSPVNARYETIHTTQTVTQNTLNDYRLTGINTAEATQYRIRPIDGCKTFLGSATSLPVSSIALGVQPGNEQATLIWKGNNINVQRYEIFRGGTLLASVTKNVTTYTDQNLACGQNYCYRVRGIENGGISASVSAERCVQISSSSTPPAGYLYTTYNQDNHVKLVFTAPQGQVVQQVRYRRSIDGEPYTDIVTTEETEYIDQLQTPNAACYRSFYTNPCNKESIVSNTSCPVYLIVLPQDNARVVTLGWTGYVGFPDGIGKYEVELLDQNNQVIASYQATGNTYADRNLSSELQDLRYRVKVTSGNGIAVSYSNTEIVKQPLEVHVPTAFTPNNDGLNDVLEVKGRFIKDFHIKIYNSIGHVVFTSSDRANSWDGTYQGKPQPAGAYAYEINITTANGEKKRRTGSVTLLR